MKCPSCQSPVQDEESWCLSCGQLLALPPMPKHPEQRFQCVQHASQCLAEGRATEAITLYRQAIALDPLNRENAELYDYMGDAFSCLQKPHLARQAYHQAVALAPTEARLRRYEQYLAHGYTGTVIPPPMPQPAPVAPAPAAPPPPAAPAPVVLAAPVTTLAPPPEDGPSVGERLQDVVAGLRPRKFNLGLQLSHQDKVKIIVVCVSLTLLIHVVRFFLQEQPLPSNAARRLPAATTIKQEHPDRATESTRSERF